MREISLISALFCCPKFIAHESSLDKNERAERHSTMSDNATTTPATPAAEPTAAATTTQATPSAGTQNTETPAEVMIPKSRFDEVNNRLKAIEGERTKAQKEAEAAETARLAEQGEYKKLFEKQQSELETERKARRDNEIKLLQRDAATQTNLPAALAERLKGDTLEEMVADAQAILAALPKPTAPNINAGAGAGGAPAAGALDESNRQRIADKYGVDPRYLQ